ncbi:hypothetical protein M513_05237 [Trichuris suis]|uniref:Uncharacterized protein n=1 Tax=Trichuris suis TaxID=68888 RepID=A0A085M9S4_9BILA|nr:hypothetical protein M513_05237 [Trichuris suis]
MAAHNASVDVDGLRKRHSGLRSRIGRLLENVERFINDGQVAVAHETFELLDTSGKCRDMQAEFELCLTDQNLQDQEIQRYVDMELQKLKHAQRSKQLVSIKSKPTITVAREQRKVSGSNLSEWQLPKFSDDVFGFPSFWDQSRSGVHGREDSDFMKLRSIRTGTWFERKRSRNSICPIAIYRLQPPIDAEVPEGYGNYVFLESTVQLDEIYVKMSSPIHWLKHLCNLEGHRGPWSLTSSCSPGASTTEARGTHSSVSTYGGFDLRWSARNRTYQIERQLTEDQEAPEPRNPEQAKTLSTKDLYEDFLLLENAMAIFTQKDPQQERSAQVNRMITDAYGCYREIYERKKRHAQQRSLDRFLQHR